MVYELKAGDSLDNLLEEIKRKNREKEGKKKKNNFQFSIFNFQLKCYTILKFHYATFAAVEVIPGLMYAGWLSGWRPRY
jgi:hypothetical protein